MSTQPSSYDPDHRGDRYDRGDSADGFGSRRQMPLVRRGDIFYADLSPVIGSEQGGLRPVLIVQNDVGNRYSPTVIAAAITSRMGKTRLPTHIDIYADRVGLAKDSVILLEQIRTLDKRRLREKMGHLDEMVMAEVNNAIAVSFGLHEGIRETGAREAGIRDTAQPGIAAASLHTETGRHAGYRHIQPEGNHPSDPADGNRADG